LEKENSIGNDAAMQSGYKKFSELKIGENNVNVIGRVAEVRPIKKFQTPKRSGQLARLVLKDASGDFPVVIWDKAADIVNSDKIKVGTLIAIANAYTKESLNKTPEVHVGGLSRILVDPKVDEKYTKGIPEVKEDVKKIGELKSDDISSTHGKIIYLYPKSEFQRSDGRTGQRASLIIGDDSGKIRAVLWDSNADSVENFSEGDVVKIENGQVREGTRGSEIHVGNRGRVLPSDMKIDVPDAKPVESKSYKIAEIEPSLQNVSVAGRVMRILPIKEFSSGDRSGKLASVILVDETGMSRAVLWNEKADHTKELNPGDIILIKNAYTKENLNGEAEVHVSQRGVIQVNPENIKIADVAELASKHSDRKKISEIKPDDRNIEVSGKIKDVDESQMVFEICSECGSRVENVAGEWICDICGEVSPAYGMVISCTVSDGSGDIRAVFYRDLAEQLTGMSVPDALNIIGQSGDENEPARQAKSELVGSELTLTGNVRYNDYQDKLEIMASSVKVSSSNTPKESASKEEIPEDVPEEVLKDDDSIIEEDIEVEEISLEE
jgi:replication factor A1